MTSLISLFTKITVCLILMYLTLFVKSAYADHFPPPNDACGHNIIDGHFYSNNKSNIIWQVGFRAIYNYGQPSRQYTGSTTWKLMANSSNCPEGNLCAWVPSLRLNNDDDEGPFGVQWGTACIDPVAEASPLDPSQTRSCNEWFLFQAQNITLNRSNIKRIGVSDRSNEYVDDIAWYEDNGGVTAYFGGFNNIDNCPKKPCQPDNSCGANECGTKGNGCGGTKNCGGCSGTKVCKGGTCVQNYGCKLNDNGNPVCAQKQCQLGDNDCYATNSCGTGCAGSIEGRVYIDKNNNNSFDSGEGYTRSNNSPNLTVQRGQINNGFNVREERAPDPDYRFGNLLKGSSHDIRVAGWKSDRLAEDSPNPRTNVAASSGGTSASFRFRFKKYRVFGTVWWDPDGIPKNGDETRYANVGSTPGKTVKVCVVGKKCDETDRSGADRGNFNITDIPTNLADNGAKYTVRVSDFRPAHHVSNNNQEINVKSDNVRVDFYISPDLRTHPISGTIFVDNPTAGTPGVIDAADTRYKGTASQKAKIEIVGTDRFDEAIPGSSPNAGDYSIVGNPEGGNYDVRLRPNSLRPLFSTILSPNPVENVRVDQAPVGNIDFLVQKAVSGDRTIDGALFLDNPPVGGGFGAEDTFIQSTGSERVTIGNPPDHPDQRINDETGDPPGFLFDSLGAGSYSVRFINVRPTHYVSFHSNPYSVTVGDTCSAPSPASCQDGDVTNVLFGIAQSTTGTSWIQGVGGYMRSDGNMSASIPGGNYLSITSSPTLLSPGIVFNFNLTGSVSTEGWRVTGSKYRSGNIKTSFNTLSDLLRKQKSVVQKNLFGVGAPCGNGTGSDCSFQGTGGGYYFSNDRDVTLNEAEFNNALSTPTNFYVIRIDGDLTIDTGPSAWNVPQGVMVLFAVKGNITIKPNVTHLEGIFSTDGDFIVGSGASDSQLIIEGSVIANAVRSGGGFDNKRSLGDDNATTPSVKIIYRPDFVLNAPTFLRYSNVHFQELPPSGR